MHNIPNQASFQFYQYFVFLVGNFHIPTYTSYFPISEHKKAKG